MANHSISMEEPQVKKAASHTLLIRWSNISIHNSFMLIQNFWFIALEYSFLMSYLISPFGGGQDVKWN